MSSDRKRKSALELRKETLRKLGQLSDDNLQQVVGGATRTKGGYNDGISCRTGDYCCS